MNHDGLADYQEVKSLLDAVDEHIEGMRNAGCQLAKNDRDYRVAVASETLRLKAQGMPATLVRDMVRGIPDIADLKCQAQCAEAIRDAEREAINSKKKRATIIHEQMNREWSNMRNN